MEQEMIELIKDCKSSNVQQKGSFKAWNGDEIDYYIIESDYMTLRFWNSSNRSGIDSFGHILETIRTELLDEETSGEFTDGWINIMWEVI